MECEPAKGTWGSALSNHAPHLTLDSAGERERSAYEKIVDGSLTHERGIS